MDKLAYINELKKRHGDSPELQELERRYAPKDMPLSSNPYQGLTGNAVGDRVKKLDAISTRFVVPMSVVEQDAMDIDEVAIHQMLTKPIPESMSLTTEWNIASPKTIDDVIAYNFKQLPSDPRIRGIAKNFIAKRKQEKAIADSKVVNEKDVLDLNMYLAYFAGGEDAAEAMGKANVFRNKEQFGDTGDIGDYLTKNPNQSFVPSKFDLKLDQNRIDEIGMLSQMDTKAIEEYFKARGMVDLGEHMGDIKDLREYMLFSDALKAMKSSEVRGAIERIQNPEANYGKSKYTESGYSPNYERDRLILRHHFFQIEEMQARGMTGGAMITDIGLNIVKYGGEIALLSGLGGNTVKAAVTTNVSKVAPAMIAENAGQLSSALIMTALHPAAVTNLTINRMTDKGYVDDFGNFVKTEEGQALIMALPKSIVEQSVTFLVEQKGDDLVKGVWKVGAGVASILPKGLVKGLDDVASYMKRTGIKSVEKLPESMRSRLSAVKDFISSRAKSIDKAGKPVKEAAMFSNLFGENLEEYFEQVVMPILKLDDQYRDKDASYLRNVWEGMKIDPEQYLYQSVVFTLIPFAAGAIGSTPKVINKVANAFRPSPTLPEVFNRIQFENSLRNTYGFTRQQSEDVADIFDAGGNITHAENEIHRWEGYENFSFDKENSTKALAAMLVDRGVAPQKAIEMAEQAVKVTENEGATLSEVVNTQEFKDAVVENQELTTEEMSLEHQGLFERTLGQENEEGSKVPPDAQSQATEPKQAPDETVSGTQEFDATGEMKQRGLGLSVAEQALNNDLGDMFADVPEYKTIRLADQAKRVSKLIETDPDRATRIAMGLEFAPYGIIPEMVYVGVANKAAADKNGELLRELATKSSLVSEATIMGQRIRSLGELDKNSAIKGIQKIVRTREAERDKRADKVEKNLKKDIAKEEKKLAKLEAKLTKKGINIESKDYGKKNRVVTKEKYEAALKRILGKGKLSSGIDPAILADVIDVATYHLEAIGRKLPQWSKVISEQLGDWIKPHLDDLWQLANARVALQDRQEVMPKLQKAIPAKQLKTALDAIKTRLKNAIADLEAQIKSREKIVKTKTDVTLDAEAKELQARRDELKKQYDEIFPKQGLTDQQRINMATKALEKSIADYEAKIKARDVSRKQGRKTPQTSEIVALKKIRDDLKQELQAIRDEIDPNRDRKARLEGQAKKLQAKIKAGDFKPVQKKEVAPDAKTQKLLDEVDASKRVIRAAKELLETQALITQDEIDVILELSEKIRETKAAMEAGKRRGIDGKPTETELAYGIALVAFENYIEAAQNKAQKRAIPERIIGWLTDWESLILDIFGTAKAIRASMDNSFIGRQGIRLFYMGITGDIKAGKIWLDTFFKSWSTIYNSLRGKPVMDYLRAEILSDPDYDLMRKAKVATAVVEEDYTIHWPSKIPYAGRLFKASEEAFTASAYYMRYRTAKMYLNIAKELGVDMNDEFQLESIGKLVNSLTARGHTGQASSDKSYINVVFWSPKMMKSHFDVLLLQPAAGIKAYAATGWAKVKADEGAKVKEGEYMSNFAAKQAAKNLMRIIMGQAMVLLIASRIWPESVEFDPRSSDFGKIKIGNTRYDITGGMGAIAVLSSRLAMAMLGQEAFKSSTTGKISKLTDTPFLSAKSVIADFAFNKTSPGAGLILDMLEREHFGGEPVTPLSVASSMVVPLPVTNVIDDLNRMDDMEAAQVLANAILEGIGISANTYKREMERP